MGAPLRFRLFSHDFAFLFQRDLTKSTTADRSLKEYPQWGQHIKLQFFERRHPPHFIAPSSNSFPQSGHFNVVFIPFRLWFVAVLLFCCLAVLPLTPKPQHCSTAKLQHKECS
jgi:hypothetical protein